MELRSAGTERRHGLKKKSTFLDELVMRFKKMSRLHGVKVTPQRLIILRELALYQGHPSAEDIHGRSALRVRRISLDTVYRTLALFERLALVKKLRFLDDRTRFDVNTSRHCHLVCENCGGITDFPFPELITRKNRADDTGDVEDWGRIGDQNVEIRGMCKACLAQENPSKGGWTPSAPSFEETPARAADGDSSSLEVMG